MQSKEKAIKSVLQDCDRDNNLLEEEDIDATKATIKVEKVEDTRADVVTYEDLLQEREVQMKERERKLDAEKVFRED